MAGLVELATPSVDALPGEESEVGVLVFNTGSAVEAYDLEVVGSVSSWSYLDPSVVRLPAGDSRTVRLVLRPPLTGDVPAGPMPFAVRLHAHADPGAEEMAEGTVDLLAFEAFTARLVPDVLEVTSRGRARVEITNDGNIPIVVHLSTESDDGLVVGLKLEDETVLVPAGTSASAWLTVKPRHRRLLGKGQPARYTVRLETLSRVADLSGQARAKGSLPLAALRCLVAGVLLAGLALAGRSVLASDGGPARSKKGLPTFIGSNTVPPAAAGGIVGVEEAPPATASLVPGATVAPVQPAPGATGGTIAPRPPDGGGPATAVLLRRFFDPALSDYIYTTDAKEAASLAAAGMVDQGVAGKVLTAKASGTVALYRLRKSDGRHVFTFDEGERRSLVSKGAVAERTAGYLYPSPTPGTTPLYRMNKDGVAYLTADNADVQSRQANGWANEGIRGYVLV